MSTIIETKRLILREYTAEDLQPLVAILSDPKTMAFWPEPFTLDRTANWIERACKSYAEYGFGRWALILKESSEQIGDCGFFRTEVDGKLENDLGYIIHAPYWQLSYAFEAAKAALEFGFGSLGLRRIAANMAHDHIGSQRVAEKIGMKKEREFINTRNRNTLAFLYSAEVRS